MIRFTAILYIVGGVVVGFAAAFFWFGDFTLPTATSSNQFDPLAVDTVDAVAHWERTLESMSYVAAYEAFKQYNRQQSPNQQHTNAHYFGEALYNVAGVDGVAVCDSDFAFGCYHALFSWGLADLGAGIIDDFDTACIDAYGEKGLGCQHGIGHGLLADMGSDELVAALELCATLNWQGPIGGCTSGVFMEYNFNTMWEGPLRSYDQAIGWHYPCESIPERFKQACYYELPQWWTSVQYDDYRFAGEQCAEAAAKDSQTACYRGLGNEAASRTHFNIPNTLAICDQMPDSEASLLCIEGATWLMAFEPVRKDDWQTMCDRLEGDAQERCLASKDFI